MELRVRDVVANIRCKGMETPFDINDMHNGYGCKVTFGLGTNDCGNQECEECFNTLITNLEERDIRSMEKDDYSDPCDGCDEDCEGCEYND